MSEVGNATVSIFPSFKGFRSKVSAEVNGATKAAGEAAGKGFSAAFDGGSSKVGDAAAKSLQRNVASASGALSKARLTEQDAAGKVRVAETQLAEARSKGEAGSARVVAAEERLASAQRKLTEATGKTKTASDQLKDAQSKLKDVTDTTASSGENAAGRYAKGWAGIKARISGDLTKAVQDAGTDASRVSESGGRESGGRFTGAFKGALAGVATIFAASKIKDFFVSGIQSAGQLEQSVGAVGAIFKAGATQMNSWASTAATDVGLTKNEFNELGTLIGAQLKNGGTAMDELGPKTKDLIGLGADLSSMFGGTSREAVEALSSALKGERDPIEKYGVSLNQTKIDAEAAALGFEKVGGALSAEANQAATLSLIMKQTADSHGNFAKENDTLAGKQQRLTAMWANGKAALATAFLPAITAVTGALILGLGPALSGAESIVNEISGGFVAFSAAFRAADGDITSSGFPGFMERVGYAASLLWAGLTMPAGVADSLNAPLDGLVAVGAVIRRTFDEARGGLKAMVQGFKDGGTDVTSSGFSGILESVGLAARNIVDALGPVVATWGPQVGELIQVISPLGLILEALAPVLPELAEAAGKLAAALGTALAGALEVAAPLIAAVLEGVADLIGKFTESEGGAEALAGGIATLVGGMLLYKGAINVVAAAKRGWAKAQKALNVVMGLSPIGKIILVIAALVVAAIWLIKNWDKVTAFFSDIWEKIKSGVSAFIGFLKDAFLKFHPLGIIISNWGAITGFFAGLWSNIVDGAKALGTGFLDFFKSLPGMLLDGLKAVGMGILKGLALGIGLAVVGIKFAFTELPGLIIGWLFDAGTWLLQTGTNLMNGFVAGVQAAWSAGVTFFTELPGKILEFLVSAGTWLLTTGTSLLQGLASGITAGYQAVVAFFTSLPGRILAFLSAAGSWLINAGRTLLDGMQNGIDNGYTAVVSFFTSLPGKVVAFLASAGTWLVGAGRNTINGLRDGLVQTWGNVTGWLASIPGAIIGAVSGAGQWLFSAGQNVVQGLLNGIRSLAGSIGKFFLDLLPGWIVGPFKTALGIHSPSRVFAGFGENIGEGVLLGVGRTESAIDRQMRSLVTVPSAPRWDGSSGQGAGSTISANARRGMTDGRPIEINVHGADDPYSVAMNVVRIMEGAR